MLPAVSRVGGGRGTAADNTTMHAKPDLRVRISNEIIRSGSVIVTVITLGHSCLKQTLFQFSTFALLVVVTMIATGVAADFWIVNSQQLTVPEPSSTGFIAALFALGFARRHRR